jgi:hypothetical protein
MDVHHPVQVMGSVSGMMTHLPAVNLNGMPVNSAAAVHPDGQEWTVHTSWKFSAMTTSIMTMVSLFFH